MTSGTLLVVDDEPFNRDLFGRRLERQGYVVRFAASGTEALERVAAGGLDLVLLDLQMPDLSGLDVLKAVRTTHSPAQLPIIMVTSNYESDAVVCAIELGANDYLTKPVDFPVAFARIRSQLARKRAEDALRESEERYHLAVRGANDGLWDWKISSGDAYFSPRWKAIVGYADDELPNAMDEWWRRVHPEDRGALQRKRNDHLSGRTSQLDAEFRMQHRDGRYRWVRCRGVATRDAQGRAVRMAGSLTDVTDAKMRDPLTGLPTRVLVVERLSRLVEQHRRRPDARFALLLVAVDQLNIVNDGLGRALVDELLVEVARRLEAAVPSPSLEPSELGEFTVARVADDEFAVVLEDLSSPDAAMSVADRVLGELSQPLPLDGQETFCSVSIGIAVSTSRYERAEDLLRDANIARRRATASATTRCEVFDVQMREEARLRLLLEAELRRALERRELRLFYQPIIHLASGRVHGFEALVRWQHPDRGLIGPGEFIEAAEKNGLIVPMGQWVLEEACRQLDQWQRTFGSGAPSAVNVNLSSQQFRSPDFVNQVLGVLRAIGLPPSCLELEITESTAMAHHEEVVSTLRGLKALNVALSIDDFGTGYSSLSYLHRFPLSSLKIDRSFVHRLPGEPSDVSIVRTIVTLAHSLSMSVVAEGIETATQLQMLRALGCEHGQGYYFAPPLSAEKATEWLQARLGFVTAERDSTSALDRPA